VQLSEETQKYQEMFALAQVLPGPGSTKMLVTIVSIHAGYIPALAVFIIWSMPSALGMYGLSLGVHQLKETLPSPVYAFLSGLNAATVGVISLAAVQLSRKAITDKLTRALVVFGGCAGLLHNALWYFPVLLVGASIVTIFWDIYLPKVQRRLKKRKVPVANLGREEAPEETGMAETSRRDEDGHSTHSVQRRTQSRTSVKSTQSLPLSPLAENAENDAEQSPTQTSVDNSRYGISVKAGIALVILFLMIFSALIGLRSGLSQPPLSLALFNNMFLAGTIIFGGGPVVIPLLREYVVQPGWVTPRDFILGLAIAQAFPGPNFCFAVYLGSLTLALNGYTPAKSFFGAMLGFLGIFTPGIWLCIAFQSLWRMLRKKRVVISLLRGVNAAAVGFVYTAVYRIWQVGYLTPTQNQGISLANEPWWLLVSATTFTLVEWYHFPPAVVIILGGLAGLGWWGAVKRD
jgi:chromate transport protein ChrA